MNGQLANGTFAPGNNLGGRKPISNAILREIAQNPAKLKAAIAAQLQAASEGDLDALDWLTCRLEGKASQSLQVSDNNSNLREYTMAELLAIVASQQLGGGGVGVGQVEGGIGTAAVVAGNQPLPIDQVNSDKVPRETMDKWMDVPTL